MSISVKNREGKVRETGEDRKKKRIFKQILELIFVVVSTPVGTERGLNFKKVINTNSNQKLYFEIVQLLKRR